MAKKTDPSALITDAIYDIWDVSGIIICFVGILLLGVKKNTKFNCCT